MDWSKPHTGNFASDMFQESEAKKAEQTLLAGGSVKCVSGDHANGNELCIEVIARFGADNARKGATESQRQSAEKAVDNLRKGWGYAKKQSDHSGGNTCADVIAKATG